MAPGLRSAEFGPRSSSAKHRSRSTPVAEPSPLTLVSTPSPTRSLPVQAKPPPEMFWLEMDGDYSSGDEETDEINFVAPPPSPHQRDKASSDSPPVTPQHQPTPLSRAEQLRRRAAERQKAAVALARQQRTPRGTHPRSTQQQQDAAAPPVGKLAKLRRKLPSRRSKRQTGFEHGVNGSRVQARSSEQISNART